MGFLPFDLEAAGDAARPAVEWEESDCLLCGSRRHAVLVEAPDPMPGGAGLWFAVVQCHDSGPCFTNPRPSLRSTGQFSPDQYTPHASRHGKSRWWRRLPFLRRRRLDRMVRAVPWNGEGRLLDFGCGGGAFL